MRQRPTHARRFLASQSRQMGGFAATASRRRRRRPVAPQRRVRLQESVRCRRSVELDAPVAGLEGLLILTRGMDDAAPATVFLAARNGITTRAKASAEGSQSTEPALQRDSHISAPAGSSGGHA